MAVSDLVDGILYKGDELGHHLADALRRVLDGHRYLSPLAYDALEIARQRVSMLTPRQLEIARLDGQGLDSTPDRAATQGAHGDPFTRTRDAFGPGLG